MSTSESDLDDLVNSLSSLDLEIESEMATSQPINVPLLRYQADNIPVFDGNPKQLNRFLNSCENFIRAFQNSSNAQDVINICLFDTILSKLRDRAADLICSRSELTTWQSVKDALTLTFSDQRSLDCLIQDLIAMKPQRNETPLQFGMRIQDARSLLFSKLNSTVTEAAEKQIKIKHYDDFALKTFINGLPYNMQLVVRLRQPDSLEKALAYVKEEENFIYFKTGQNPNLHTQPYKPQPRINQNFTRPTSNTIRHPPPSYRPFIPHYQPNFNTHTPNFQFNNNTPRAQFPNSFQNQYRPFTNTQSANNGKPNWQPFNRLPAMQHPHFANQRSSAILRNQQAKSTQSRHVPEPMDTSSSNSRIKPRQNFVTQELFAQQIENESVPSSSEYTFDEQIPDYQNYENTDCIPNFNDNTQDDMYYSGYENAEHQDTDTSGNFCSYSQYENANENFQQIAEYQPPT